MPALDAPHDHDPPHDHDRGLGFDLDRLMGRRRALSLFAGAAGLVVLGACGSKGSSSTSSASTGASTTGSAAASSTEAAAAAAVTTASAAATAVDATCTVIPEETAGPYPGDGSNGPNVLTASGIVRGDIRSSFGESSGTAEGVPLTITLDLVDTRNGCTPFAGAAVYVWHCDADGRYSMYSEGATDQNYLRGVQQADADGRVMFTSIFPACYPGRWPHIHFEVYSSLDDATAAGAPIATSQIALPEDACNLVYATDAYGTSARSLTQVSLARDKVFGDDGGVHELATMTGDATSGMTATLTVPV